VIEDRSQCSSSERGIRVAWLLPTMQGGYYWQPLLREFAKLFPNTVIFTSGWPGYVPGSEGAFDVRQLPGYRHIHLKRKGRSTDIGYEGFQWVTPWVIRDLYHFRPDVVFTSAFGLWTACALAYKALTRSRVIVLLDGVSNQIGRTNSSLRLPVRRMMGRLIDAAASNSSPGCDYLREVVGVRASKIRRHVFYVPDRTLLESEDGKGIQCNESTHPTFLFVGQIIERKGWNHLLEAVSVLQRKGHVTFSVTLVGDGPQREFLLEQIASLGLEGQVHAIGAVPYGHLGTYFEAADVLVLPSLDDTWGMVVSEAMAFGKAVLCSRLAGARELVEHGVNGYVFNPLDASELAGYMERFLVQPDLIARFGASSQEKIASHTPQLAAENLGQLACRTMGKPR
jgi:glycosyltransferase involved in cell wall biosynthesis